jgi:hypothetical protein
MLVLQMVKAVRYLGLRPIFSRSTIDFNVIILWNTKTPPCPSTLDTHGINKSAKGGEKGQMETAKQIEVRGDGRLAGGTVPRKFHPASSPFRGTVRVNPTKSD